MAEREYEIDRIIETYLRYLNGPLGKGVMDHLWEGASFTIQANHDLVQVTKQEGKAVIRVIHESNVKFDEILHKIIDV
jgi:hypothetical protein